MPPEIIAGRYRVEREVGRGGMGSVWLCRDERLGRPVAVKQVGGLPGESSMHLARALREARHSAALNHPHVVAIYDALEDGDQVWLVMEYVPSRTLDEMVRSGGPLAPSEAARICADVADGLAAAHALGTVHRDVKPSNILVRDDDGRALIADFGIARTVGQEQLTRSGLVTGTPTYFAPELARGAEPTPASDVWALGVSLYVAVEGEPPYADQANAIAVLNAIASRPPPEPTRAGPLGPALRGMLDTDPATRWTMLHAATTLRELAEAPPAAPVAADPVPTPVRPGRPADTVPTAAQRAVPPEPPERPEAPEPPVEPPPDRRRRPALLALSGLLVLALLAAGGWWLTRDRDDSGGLDPASGPRSTPAGKASRTPSTTAPPSSSAPEPSDPTAATSSAPEPSDSAPTPPASPAAGGEDAATALVTDYYTLLPEDTDAAWDLLSPELQAEIGQGTFEGFWATIDDVRVDGTDDLGDGLVQVTLTYTTDGRSEQETRQLEVSEADGGLLISDDQGAV